MHKKEMILLLDLFFILNSPLCFSHVCRIPNKRNKKNPSPLKAVSKPHFALSFSGKIIYPPLYWQERNFDWLY